MTDSAPVADDRDKLTHKNIPEHLVAKGRDSGGNIHLGEIKYLHQPRDPYGNPLPPAPRFGDLLTPTLNDLRVTDWHRLPPMGDKTTARYIAELAHLPEVVKATEKAHKVDTRWQSIHADYRKAVADRDDWIRTTRTEIQVDANRGGQKHGVTKATADHLAALDAIVNAYERILGPVARQGASVGHLNAAPGANLQQSIIADAVADLLQAAADQTDMGTRVAVALATGIRRGELEGLQWQDIEDGELWVRRQRYQDGKVGLPKNEKERRVPFGPDTARRLKAWRIRRGVPDPGEWVFPTEHWHRWDKVRGAVPEPPPRWHDLRHTAATFWLAAGITVHAVADLLGHEDATLVLKLYGHALPQEKNTAGEVMDAFRRSAGKAVV